MAPRVPVRSIFRGLAGRWVNWMRQPGSHATSPARLRQVVVVRSQPSGNIDQTADDIGLTDVAVGLSDHVQQDRCSVTS